MPVLWVYEIPTWLLGVLIVVFFCVLTCAGLPLARRWQATRIGEGDVADHNTVISAYLSAIGVFYGLVVGLIAVAAWQNLEDLQAIANREAASLAKLYRDTAGYPTEQRALIQQLLRGYTDCVIDKEWPMQQKGKIALEGFPIVGELVIASTSFEPRTEGQKIVHAEFFKVLNELQELRRQRISAVSDSIPPVVWAVVWIGAFVLVALTYLFRMESLSLHLLLNTSLAITIGLLVFLIVAMDHPFWGDFSVSSEVFENMRTLVIGRR